MTQSQLAGQRYRFPVSEEEMKRRLAEVQSAMKAEGLDCCIAQCHCTIFDSVVRYMTDMRTNAYSTALIIPADGLITIISSGWDNDNSAVRPSMRNIEKAITKPFCQPFECTDGLAASTIVKELKARNPKRLGIIYRQFMSFDLGKRIEEELSGAELIDFSKQFSRIKAVKSDEEWVLLDRCIRAHEHLIDTVPSLLRPGRMEFEVIADLEHAAKYLECEWNGNVAVGAMPKGSSSPFASTYTANRRIEPGDVVTVMIEAAGPGGMYGELARTFCLGEVHKELAELYDIALGAQRAVANAMKPGVSGADLNRVYNEFVLPHGLPANGRFVGHGQGYDMMEAPTIAPTEGMLIEEGMHFAIHPELDRGKDFAIACDNYRVRQDGAELLTRTAQKIFIVEY